MFRRSAMSFTLSMALELQQFLQGRPGKETLERVVCKRAVGTVSLFPAPRTLVLADLFDCHHRRSPESRRKKFTECDPRTLVGRGVLTLPQRILPKPDSNTFANLPHPQFQEPHATDSRSLPPCSSPQLCSSVHKRTSPEFPVCLPCAPTGVVGATNAVTPGSLT